MAESGLKRLADESLTRDPAYERLSLADLRLARQVLVDEVEKVTYWRLIIRSKLERQRAGRPSAARLSELRRALAHSRASRARIALVPGGPEEPTELPDLVELLDREVDRADPRSAARLELDLVGAEEVLSAYRAELQRRTDHVTQQLIVRYREAPALALLLLPPLAESPWADAQQLRNHHRPFEPLSTSGDRVRFR